MFGTAPIAQNAAQEAWLRTAWRRFALSGSVLILPSEDAPLPRRPQRILGRPNQSEQAYRRCSNPSGSARHCGR
jgi:hypothetical protein